MRQINGVSRETTEPLAHFPPSAPPAPEELLAPPTPPPPVPVAVDPPPAPLTLVFEAEPPPVPDVVDPLPLLEDATEATLLVLFPVVSDEHPEMRTATTAEIIMSLNMFFPFLLRAQSQIRTDTEKSLKLSPPAVGLPGHISMLS